MSLLPFYIVVFTCIDLHTGWSVYMLYYVDFREDVQERFLLYKERREQKLKMLKVRNVSSVLLAKWFNQCSKSGSDLCLFHL